MIKISSAPILKAIFKAKGNFAPETTPRRIEFGGIELTPFKGAKEAAVCISADFELNWAWRELGAEDRDARGKRERENTPQILRMLQEYAIPATWATVGHLFLSRCERGLDGLPHSYMSRPPLNRRWEGDWYLHDPCTNFEKDPLWYAPDLIEQIKANSVPQEIGTHSFSHIDFSDDSSNKALVRRELEVCRSVMEPFGIKPKSLVFPFNRMGYQYLDILAEFGIIAVRHRDQKVRLSYPERTITGVYKIYESMNLRRPRLYDYPDKAKIFIEKAIERNAVYHLWFHPSDPIQLFENEFRRIVEQICRERERGSIWVATMSEIASYCEAREKTSLRVERDEKEVRVFVESSLDCERYGVPEVTLLIPVDKAPKSLFVEFADREALFDSNSVFEKRNGHKMVINVPVSARLLKLVF